MPDALKKADEVLQQAVQGITDLINVPGLINLDFADVQTVMTDKGIAHIGIGSAKGDDKAIEAVKRGELAEVSAGYEGEITYGDGTTEQFAYNDKQLVTWMKDRNGNETSCSYDSRGHLTSSTDGRGNKKNFEYDGSGNLVTSVDSIGGKTTYTYDAMGNVTSYSYDGQGNISTSADANGNTWKS